MTIAMALFDDQLVSTNLRNQGSKAIFESKLNKPRFTICRIGGSTINAAMLCLMQDCGLGHDERPSREIWN